MVLRNASEAEDATQEALARAWKRRHTLRTLDSAPIWFDRIVLNVCRDQLRRRKVIRWLPMPQGAGEAATDQFTQALLSDDLFRALSGLNVDHQIVVVLRYWRDMTIDEIAQRLDVPVGTVKSRLHYAIRDLRAAMGEATKDEFGNE